MLKCRRLVEILQLAKPHSIELPQMVVFKSVSAEHYDIQGHREAVVQNTSQNENELEDVRHKVRGSVEGLNVFCCSEAVVHKTASVRREHLL